MSYCVFCREDKETDGSSDIHILAASQAFAQLRHDLQGAIEDTTNLTHRLTSKNIIPESTKKRIIVSGLTGFEISIALLDAVEAGIQTHPRVFDSFLDLLQSDIMLQSFAGQLLESYRKYAIV